MKKNGRRKKVGGADLLDMYLTGGVGSAVAGWGSEYVHEFLEQDPQLRKKLRKNAIFILERLIEHMRRDKQ